MEADNSKENNKKKAAAGKKNPGKQKSARTSSAKQKASKKAQPTKPAKKRIIKKQTSRQRQKSAPSLRFQRQKPRDRQAAYVQANLPRISMISSRMRNISHIGKSGITAIPYM